MFTIRSSVCLVTSTRAGMGKSLYIRKIAQRYSEVTPVVFKIPLHGPIVSSDGLTKQLKETVTEYSNAIIHLDIASAVRYYFLGHIPLKAFMYHVNIQ